MKNLPAKYYASIDREEMNPDELQKATSPAGLTASEASRMTANST